MKATKKKLFDGFVLMGLVINVIVIALILYFFVF